MKIKRIQWLVIMVCILVITTASVCRHGLLSSGDISINALITDDDKLYLLENDKVIGITSFSYTSPIKAEWEKGSIVLKTMAPEAPPPLPNLKDDILPLLLADDGVSSLISGNDYEIVGIFLHDPEVYRSNYASRGPYDDIPSAKPYNENTLDLLRERFDIPKMFFANDSFQKGEIRQDTIYALLKIGEDLYKVQIDIKLNEVSHIEPFFD